MRSTALAVVCLGAALLMAPVAAATESSDDARRALAEHFPGVASPVDTTAGLGARSHVQRYLGNRGAVVKRGRRTRYIVSTAPIRTSDKRSINLALTELPGDAMRPVAAPYYFVADNAPADGFTIGPSGAAAFDIAPLGVAEGARFSEEGSVLVAAGTHTDTDTVMRPTPAGLSSFEVLRSASAPTEFRYRLRLNNGQTAVQDGDSVLVRTGHRADVVITAPVAVDAGGQLVPIELRLDGTELVMSVDHRRQAVTYPVLADPEWTTSYDWDAGMTGNEGWFVDPNSDSSYYNVGIFGAPDPGIRITPKTGQVFPENVLGSMLWQAPGTARISSVTFANVFRQNDTARQAGRLQLSTGAAVINDDHAATGPGVAGDVTLDDPSAQSRWAAVKLFTPPCTVGESNCPRFIPNGNLSVIKVGSVSITLVDNEPPTTSATGPLRALADQWTRGDQSATVDLVASDSGLGVKTWEFTVTDSAGTHAVSSGAPTCDDAHQTPGQGSNICPASDSRTGVTVDLNQLAQEGAQRFKLSAVDLLDQSSDDGGASSEWTTYIDRSNPTITASGPLASSPSTWITPEDLDARVRLDAADSVSGVKSTRLRVADDAGAPLADETTDTCTPQGPVAQPCPNTYGHDITLDPDTLPEGKLQFSATATDFVGLTSPARQWGVFLDRTPPIGRAAGDLVALSEQWTGQTGGVAVEVQGRDRLSGVDRLALQVKNADGYRTLSEVATCGNPADKDPADGSCPHLTSKTLTVDAAELPDGRNEFIVAAWDLAGHRSRDTDRWDTYVDHTPPPTPTGLKVTDNGTNTAIATWNPVQDLPEGAPGVTYEYAVTDPGQQFVTWTSTPYPMAPVTLPSPGQIKVVRVRARDKVGHVSGTSEIPVARAALRQPSTEEIYRALRLNELDPQVTGRIGREATEAAVAAKVGSRLASAAKFGTRLSVVAAIVADLKWTASTACEESVLYRQVSHFNSDDAVVFAAVRSAKPGPQGALRGRLQRVVTHQSTVAARAGDWVDSVSKECQAPGKAALKAANDVADVAVPAAQKVLVQLERQGERRQAWADTNEAMRDRPLQPRRCEDAKYLWDRLSPGPGRRNYVVYWAPPPPRTVRYVGRSRNFPDRCRKHNREIVRSRGQTLRLPPLTYIESRQVEEALIAHFGLAERRLEDFHNITGQFGQLSNLRHEISRLRPDYCAHLVRGQFILYRSGYKPYAAAYYTKGISCPGVGGPR